MVHSIDIPSDFHPCSLEGEHMDHIQELGAQKKEKRKTDDEAGLCHDKKKKLW